MGFKDKLNEFINYQGLRKDGVARHLRITTAYLYDILKGRKIPSFRLRKEMERYIRDREAYLSEERHEEFVRLRLLDDMQTKADLNIKKQRKLKRETKK